MNDEMNTALLDLSARLSAIEFLLVQAYAPGWANDADGFNAFMDQSLQRVRTSMRKAEPAETAEQAEDYLELQTRIAVHLDRFRKAVQAAAGH